MESSSGLVLAPANRAASLAYVTGTGIGDEKGVEEYVVYSAGRVGGVCSVVRGRLEGCVVYSARRDGGACRVC